jgi:hypothetical protein
LRQQKAKTAQKTSKNHIKNEKSPKRASFKKTSKLTTFLSN